MIIDTLYHTNCKVYSYNIIMSRRYNILQDTVPKTIRHQDNNIIISIIIIFATCSLILLIIITCSLKLLLTITCSWELTCHVCCHRLQLFYEIPGLRYLYLKLKDRCVCSDSKYLWNCKCARLCTASWSGCDEYINQIVESINQLSQSTSIPSSHVYSTII